MTPKRTYSEKLKDPKWQKKRLEILNRDNFTCKSCCDNEKTLHVHHLVYIKGNEPWEYEENLLITLCEDCHQEIEYRQIGQCDELIFHFKTKLKDGFLRNCAVELFKRDNDLHDLIYLLWEATHLPEDRDKVKDFLTEIMTSRSPFQ